MESVRILIVDDNARFRKALRMFLESRPGLTVVGEAENGSEGVAKAQSLDPDLTIMDLNMPQLDGVQATRKLRELKPDSAVLVLTEHNSVPLVCEALEAGAKGFLPKSDMPQLLAALKAALGS